MSVRTRYDEANNLYSLGDDIDGVFVAFVNLPGDSVRGTIASAQVAERELEAAGGHRPTDVTPEPGATINAADFTDNGDGTYTRQSDGVQGRFTPSGFEPVSAP